jgi:carbon-monoxide dehydrogenase small subunit
MTDVTDSREQIHEVSLRVNGTPQQVRVPARRLLSDCLRHDLRLTGTHVGCEHGVCGACTVLVDGEPMRSCLLFAVSVEGRDVTTVEGLADADGTPHPVQQAFRECHACSAASARPGFLTTVAAYLETHPDPSEDEARRRHRGNLCRCTGYQNIVASVLRAPRSAVASRATTAWGRAHDPPRMFGAPCCARGRRLTTGQGRYLDDLGTTRLLRRSCAVRTRMPDH